MSAFVDQKRWEKWKSWAQTIEDDLALVVDDRNEFDTFQNVVLENLEWILSHQGESFSLFVRRSYVANACMGIRRQLKDRDDAISLIRLMREVKDSAAAITFDRFCAFMPGRDRSYTEWREPTFAKLSADGKVVSADRIQQHMDRVKTLNAQIEELADRTIAHHDPRGTSAIVKVDDVQASLAHFDELAQTYIQFFTGFSMGGTPSGPAGNTTPSRSFGTP